MKESTYVISVCLCVFGIGAVMLGFEMKLSAEDLVTEVKQEWRKERAKRIEAEMRSNCLNPAPSLNKKPTTEI